VYFTARSIVGSSNKDSCCRRHTPAVAHLQAEMQCDFIARCHCRALHIFNDCAASLPYHAMPCNLQLQYHCFCSADRAGYTCHQLSESATRAHTSSQGAICSQAGTCADSTVASDDDEDMALQRAVAVSRSPRLAVAQQHKNTISKAGVHASGACRQPALQAHL
jgi:hypothetical protein